LITHLVVIIMFAIAFYTIALMSVLLCVLQVTFIFDIVFLTFLLYIGHLNCSIPFAVLTVVFVERVRGFVSLCLSICLVFAFLRTFI